MNPDHNPFKILVIDDEKYIRQSFADFLEDRNFKVLVAQNGRIGLELLKVEKPDLVLLDLRMPELDGLEVLKQGKKTMPETPMIVISGANRTRDVVQALRYGAWDYLEKPVQDFSILGHAVEKALEKARLRQENRDYQENLETMVKERTLELESANTHLSDINTRLRKIVETTQRLAGCRDIKQFGLKILDEFSTHMSATGGSLYLLEDKGLRLMHALDPGHAADFLTVPLDENSILNTLLKQGQPLLIEDIRTADTVVSSGWPGYSDGSLLAFPISDSDGRTIGAILLHNKKDPPFIHEDLEIGSILASYSSETLRAITAFDAAQKSKEQLRQSQKMEAIGTLAGGIAHDFNNILSSILGYAQLVEMNISEPDDVRKNIDQVVKGARRAGELVKQILAFSRQNESEKQPLKIYLVIKEAVKFLRSSIPSSIDIIENIHTRNMVLADATQIHQVVMNLCTNAYQAMQDKGGTLSVSLCDRMMVDSVVLHKPGPYIELEIKDTGPGIEERFLNRIFDPYFTTKKFSQGTGLGLAVVEGIVKNHRGFIKVHSKTGCGTAVQVFFPVAGQSDPGSQVKPLADKLTGTEKIMLVDDEEDILKTSKMILERLGYHVSEFMDGISAMAAFEADPQGFNLIITDMAMPKMDGRVLSKKILALRKDIPIILCTGYHETFTEEAALRAGIRRYVQKPLTGKDLALIIRDELKKKG